MRSLVTFRLRDHCRIS